MSESDFAALAAIEEQVESITFECDVHQHDAPDTLFHYTTLGGLLGIINTRSLWFSDVRYSNDPLEAWYGRRLVEEGLRVRLPVNIVRQVLALLDDNARYVTSFSTNGDLL
jgi:hypothetical protein